MAKLLVSLIYLLGSVSAIAAGSGTGTGEMLSDRQLSNKFIATIQESKIEKQLTGASEFTTCQKLTPLKSGEDNTKNIEAIQKCFTDKLKGKSVKQLGELSDKLGLQSYGIVQSKSAKDITSYLSKKINKALTGTDPDEKDLKAMIESSKFKNHNVIDQQLFFKLYQTQLGKNVLFEISRFCYNDLGNTNAPSAPTTFKEYWNGGSDFYNFVMNLSPDQLKSNEKAIQGFIQDGSIKASDEDKVARFNIKVDSSKDNKDQLDSIVSNFTTLDQAFSENFFTFCSRLIKPMCMIFQDNTSKDKDNTNMLGAKACLTQARLEQYRKALAKTSEYVDKLSKDADTDMSWAIAGMKIYDGKGDNSIDAITSISSTDILKSQSKEYKAKIENFDSAKCAASPELADCEVFSDSKQDQFEIDNVNLKMSIRDAAELARIEEMVKNNDKNLEQYLTDNGYADLVDKVKNGKTDEIAGLLSKKFDAKKAAYLKELGGKVAPYQVSDTEDKASKAESAMESVKAQQGNLAQLVMFNNIISSSFELKNSKGDSLGRNTSGIDREYKDAKALGLDNDVFSNIRDTGSTGQPQNNNNQNNSITGLQFLDSILGFEDEKPQ